MGYVKTIVCLAKSFKTGGNCIAGKEILSKGPGGWIRPVSDREDADVRDAECQYSDHSLPKLLDIIEIHLLRHEPRRHQTENHVLDLRYRWVKIGDFPLASVPQLLDTPDQLWINSDSTSAGVSNCMSEDEAATQKYSLALVRPEKLSLEIGSNSWSGKRTYMCSFRYNRAPYTLKLTDPVFTNAYQSKDEGVYPLGNTYICVSLTEPWDVDKNRCHKLVAGIIPNHPL